MSVIDKILEEIDKTMECGLIDYINGDPVITKKKAKDIIRKHMDGAEYPYIIGKDIEADPSANKEFLAECRKVAKKYGKNDGWIPVNERLPEGNKTVLVCQQGGAIETAWHDGYRWKTGFSHADWIRDVVAWRPLPEPYNPERIDNHDGE